MAIYMKIGDIEGESSDKAHQKWIDLLSYSFGVSQTADLMTPGRGEASDFTFQHLVDKASPILFMRCAQGEHVSMGQLDVTRADAEGRQDTFLMMKFHEVLLSSVQQGGSSGDERPAEFVSFKYAKIEIAYKEMATGGVVEASWDFSMKKI